MIKKTLGILFKLFLICFFSIVVFYTGLSFFGLWTIARLAHEENTRSEAEKKYIPPKPVEIKIEGCPSGSWNTKLYGYVEVLDTRIEVPCSLSNGQHFLVGRQFFLQWQDVISTSDKSEIYFGTVYQGTDRPIVSSDFTTPPALKEMLSVVEVSLPKNSLGAKTAYFDCAANSCRGWVAVASNVRALINVYDERGINKVDLTAVVIRVFSRVK